MSNALHPDLQNDDIADLGLQYHDFDRHVSSRCHNKYLHIFEKIKKKHLLRYQCIK